MKDAVRVGGRLSKDGSVKEGWLSKNECDVEKMKETNGPYVVLAALGVFKNITEI